MIAEAPGPVSGYDLMKLFDLSMSHYWHAYQGQIYPTLERMADFGIIKGRSVSKGWRPKVRLYTITQSGLRLLVEWLESTFEEVRLKHPPLLRCRFLGHLGPDGAVRILEEERAAWARHLAVYRNIEKNHFGGGKAYRDVATMFAMFTLRRGIDWTEENIAWCDWAMAEIERNRALFPAVSTKDALPPLVPIEPIGRARE
jgi:PadR family transcriptional regulator, regulatory protein AphA